MQDTAMASSTWSGQEGLIHLLCEHRPRYVGIYAPGDFHGDTYRFVVPDPTSPGHGFRGCNERIVFDSPHRLEVDECLNAIKGLVNSPDGPLAVRHIVNPSGKDEGLRLIWPQRRPSSISPSPAHLGVVDSDIDIDADISSEAEIQDSPCTGTNGLPSQGGLDEMADWPRRDDFIRQGKPVRAQTPFFPDDEWLLRSPITSWAQHAPTTPWVLPLGLGVVNPSTTLHSLDPWSPISPVSPETLAVGFYAQLAEKWLDVGRTDEDEYMSVSE